MKIVYPLKRFFWLVGKQIMFRHLHVQCISLLNDKLEWVSSSFSSPEQKAKFFWSAFVRCHHCFHKLITMSSSSPEPLEQFKPNLAQGLIVWFRYLLNVSEIFYLVKVLNMEPIEETLFMRNWCSWIMGYPWIYISTNVYKVKKIFFHCNATNQSPTKLWTKKPVTREIVSQQTSKVCFFSKGR